MTADKEKYYRIASLEKGVRVIELLAEEKALTVSEVAKRLDFNRAASHRFLATLRDLGYVEKNQDGRYQLTFRVLEMGVKVAARSEIRQEARPFMQSLSAAFKETVNLGYWDGKDILHIDKIDSPEILRIDAPLGTKTPAYCTALGKAVLAHLPDAERNAYLNKVRLAPNGPNTIVSRKKLREELNLTRGRGYAVDDEELARGLRCVAAPVFDHAGQARYAVSVSFPSMRLSMEDVDRVHPTITDACRKLSAHLGYRGPEQRDL